MKIKKNIILQLNIYKKEINDHFIAGFVSGDESFSTVTGPKIFHNTKDLVLQYF